MGASDQGVVSGRWKVIPRSLCFILFENDVLLMKRGLHKRAFPGMYNGIGGHIEHDEDPMHGALREITEETGLKVRDLRLCGVSNIDAGQDTGIMLFIFSAIAESRDFVENTEHLEGTLHWIPIEQVFNGSLPYVEDLPIYLRRVCEPTASLSIFYAHVGYDSTDKMVLSFA
jgi:8-oxo-dGTP diphosphatase